MSASSQPATSVGRHQDELHDPDALHERAARTPSGEPRPSDDGTVTVVSNAAGNHGADHLGSDRLPAASLQELQEITTRIVHNVERVIAGKTEVIRMALVTLLAQGHLLIEDVPGVGKTSLAKALARSIDCTASRIQFTPDLMPSDVTGVSIYNRSTGNFEFRRGPVFANIVLGDEINRASPKTQSALLECMAEQQVTVDDTTYHLQGPFMVIATQNPIEMEGTFALPEAQRDRFSARVSIGYPDVAAELAMVDEHASIDPLATLRPVSDAAQVSALIQTVRLVHVAPEMRGYAVDLVASTRRMPELRLGASPRATLHLLRASKAFAALAGREFLVPDDIHAVAVPVLAHRLVLTPEAAAGRRNPADLIRGVLNRTPIPRGARGSGAQRQHEFRT